MNFTKEGHKDLTYAPPDVPPSTHQQCRICNTLKPLSSFLVRSDTTKYRTNCNACRSICKAATDYNTTREHLLSLLSEQNNCCRICGSDGSDHKSFSRLVVDHDHTTGEVRGLLCHTCNVGLGHFKDSPELLQAAITYLSSNTTKGISL